MFPIQADRSRLTRRQLPADVDVMCLDREAIRDRQALQVAGDSIPHAEHISTVRLATILIRFINLLKGPQITSSLHHLRMYRLQSRIMCAWLFPLMGDLF